MKHFIALFSLFCCVSINAQQAPQQTIDPNDLPQIAHQGRVQKLLDHPVVRVDGKLQPWTTYDTLFRYSMNFLKYCPLCNSPEGQLPLYLVTSKLEADGAFLSKQNNQGSNTYWGMETFKRYYAYTGDRDALMPVQRLIERVARFHTPTDFAWPDVPRTQDDSPDGLYTDEWGGVDKLCMVAIAYINFDRFTGGKSYFKRAEFIARTVVNHIKEGTATESPLPFRVNFRTGQVLDPYCSNMILPVQLIDELLASDTSLDRELLKQKRDLLIRWTMDYPMKNYLWSGYYEDVAANFANLNQQNPMETARYLLNHPSTDPLYKQHVPMLLAWVKDRFGVIAHYGATGIMEQDGCFMEMSSHTARYASIAAKWFGVSGDEAMREEARASFALSTYSAHNKYSKDSISINYTGLGYVNPWFSDSYWDYLSHFLEGIAEMPEMIPAGTDHLFSTTSMITDIAYGKDRIAYTAFDKQGTERLKLTFTPKVYANGKPLSASDWSYGTFRGVKGILTIHRNGQQSIEIRREN